MYTVAMLMPCSPTKLSMLTFANYSQMQSVPEADGNVITFAGTGQKKVWTDWCCQRTSHRNNRDSKTSPLSCHDIYSCYLTALVTS